MNSPTEKCCPSKLLPCLIIGLSLIAFALILGKSISRMRNDQGITIKGFAQKKIASDWGTWTGTLTVRSSTLSPAYARMESDSKILQQYLLKAGIPKESVILSSISLEIKKRRTPEGYESNQIELYELTQRVTASSTDVHLIDRLSKEGTSLIKEGLEIQSGAPQFFYTKIDDLKIEMLGLAAKDARVRAEKIAESSQTHVGGLRSAQQGIFQITPLYSSEISSEGMFDTSSIEKNIRAIVTVSYSVH